MSLSQRTLQWFAVVTVVVCFKHPQAVRAVDETIAPPDFNRDIRPILSDNCFSCHGPDKQKAGLRLDARDVAIRAADSGAVAIVPGKPDESEMLKRLRSDDADEKMPPASSHKSVSPKQVATLEKWIATGAAYQQHWAFVPPVRPAVPQLQDQSDWIRTPIDAFVLAKLKENGLSPSEEADPVTLLRRLYLDLVGLPPSPAEVDAYLADRSPDAYDKVVERLLVSPHYGERWGRHWLDAARYADTNGYEKDAARSIYFYRDWVIAALNHDEPYDQFITEQLAGDLLPKPSQDQIVATGYLRNSMLNEEGGVDPEQFRMEGMFDRMDAIGKGILGLTIQCAQCHNHKFDPISQEEYYRLFAFLNNDHEASRIVYTPQQQSQIANLLAQVREKEDALRPAGGAWQKTLADWEQGEASAPKPTWQVLSLENTGNNAQRYTPLEDGSLLAGGFAPTVHTATFQSVIKADADKPRTVGSLRLELLTDPNLPCGGPGRGVDGMCLLTDFSVEVGAAGEKPRKAPFGSASADFEQAVRPLTVEPEASEETAVAAPDARSKAPPKKETARSKAAKTARTVGPVRFAIDGDKTTAWGIDAGPGRRNVDRKAVFNLKTPVEIPAGQSVTLQISLAQLHGGANANDNTNNNLGRFRISVCDDLSARADPMPRRVRAALAVAPDARSGRQNEQLFSYWRTTVNEYASANAEIESLWRQWPEGTPTLTLQSRETQRETHLFKRGDWLQPGQVVTPGVPAALNPLPAGSHLDRLALARWATSRQAPTTARVAVNRVWQQYFGIGLVATPEDLGTQSEPPSDQPLLDWLAVQFMDDGWSFKRLHRLIVSSSAYRQSSRIRPSLQERDPYNRLIARAGRFRVEGEIVRDIALSSSGLLNEQVGGRSVMPPAPAFLFQPPASYGAFPWVDEKDDQKYRRAVYTYRRRSTPYPVLQTFDVPNGDVSCVRRLRTNSPLQALAALNEPMFVESAVHLARRAMESGGNGPRDQLAYAFRCVLARSPSEEELNELSELLNKQRVRFAESEPSAAELLGGAGVDPATAVGGVKPADWAAMSVVCRVLLNLDEAMTRE